MKKLIAVLVLATAAIFAGAAPASAAPEHPQFAANATMPGAALPTDVEDFTFSSFTADYFLTKASDGTAHLRTVETLVAQFPDYDQNRGIVRAIPDNYDGVPLEPEVESIVDANGKAVPFTAHNENGFLVLELGTDDFVRGTQTYTISYTSKNVIRAFSDTKAEEFYWDVNGTGFPQSFGRVDARVHVPADLVGALTGASACYYGPQGSDAVCPLAQEADPAGGSRFSAGVSDLGGQESLTVSIAFQLGTFVVPDPPLIQIPLEQLILFILLVLLLLSMIGVRLFGARDAAGRGTIIAEYSVPKKINLLAAANLIGRESSGMPAQFISFAVRGNLQIVDSDGPYSIVFRNDEGLDEQERRIFDVLFGVDRTAGDTQTLSVKPNALSTRLHAVVTRTRGFVVKHGWRKPAPSRLLKVLHTLIVLLLLVVIYLVFFRDSQASEVPMSSWVLFAAAVLGVVIGRYCALPRWPLTKSGAEARDYLKGMRVYLTLAEADRFRMLQSPEGAQRVVSIDQHEVVKLNEQLLPFAVLWGVEKEWAEQLAVNYEQQTPDWYIGRTGFDRFLFASGLHSFTAASRTASVPVYVRSSSGSGSFSGGSGGGGFSGGGGGGGGGGGR